MKKVLLLMAVLMATLHANATEQLLSDGWRVQSSAKVAQNGQQLTTTKVNTKKWYKAQVPSTIMGTLTQNGLYKGVLEGTAYKNVDSKPFNQSWWYRNEFGLSNLNEKEHVLLLFDGICYRANVWVNGVLVASKDTLCGSFRRHLIDITAIAKKQNIVAVEVFKAQPGEPNIGFVDWNPRPADESMGLFREVRIIRTGDVSISDGSVETKLDTKTLDEAWLKVRAVVRNWADHAISGVVKGSLDGRQFEKPITLNAHEEREICIGDVEALHVVHPRLWWCHNMGKPELYDMQLAFVEGGQISDEEQLTFGIREIKDYYTSEGYRGFMLNGKPVLIRGAGWTDDIFLRDTPETNETQVQYVRDMNLNCIRFENVWGTSQNIYDLCDRYGLLVLTGWSCQWEWAEYLGKPIDKKYGGIVSTDDIALISRSFSDQVHWLRRHPSVIAWFVGSDLLPHPDLERRYVEILKCADNRPYLISAANTQSEVSGLSGMKMAGPYDYVAPNYWYSEQAPGGAFGFNTETGIGAQLPVKESLQRMIGKNLWPINEVWNYHCTASASAMNTLQRLQDVVSGRYGKPTGLDDFLHKADLTNYDGTRAMFESFRVNVPRATGIVQWMLNSARPGLYWQLYDYYLVPNASYYAVKKGNAPVQLIYDYVKHTVFAVNEQLDMTQLYASMRLYDLNGKLLAERKQPVNIAPYSSVKTFDVPTTEGVSFLFLKLTDAEGREVADNYYILSSQADEYDWSTSDWYKTEFTRYANYQPLSSLAQAEVEIKDVDYHDGKLSLTLSNHSDQVACFLRLSAKDSKDNLIVPAFWSDNYLSIEPHAEVKVDCKLPTQPQTLSIEGWNVPYTIFQ